MPKLTENQVVAIKAALQNGLKQAEIAAKYGVSRSLISDIATNRRYKQVPWPDGVQPVNLARGKRKDYDPTNERIRELESEVVLLRDELSHARKSAKVANREYGLYKAIVAEMEKRVKPFTPLPSVVRPRQKGTIEEHVVMHLSDGHHDQIVTPEECGGLENYNFPISCRRAENYVDKVLEWTQSILSPKFRFTVLTVFAYGDHTSGEIHGHTSRSYFRNQFKNCFAIGKLHGLMYRDLAPYFDAVNVVYLPGNHGRRTPKKDYHGAHDNWDYLIAETAKLHCQDIKNINFLIPNAFSVNIEVNGVGFNLSHGDDVRGNLGIPFYGMIRKQKGLIALGAVQGGPRVRYYCMGHHHTAASLADIDGELIVNGAWVATDSYVFNSFSGYKEPTQWLHGVHPKHGITWRVAVHLRSRDEAKGPKRYIIEV